MCKTLKSHGVDFGKLQIKVVVLANICCMYSLSIRLPQCERTSRNGLKRGNVRCVMTWVLLSMRFKDSSRKIRILKTNRADNLHWCQNYFKNTNGNLPNSHNKVLQFGYFYQEQFWIKSHAVRHTQHKGTAGFASWVFLLLRGFLWRHLWILSQNVYRHEKETTTGKCELTQQSFQFIFPQGVYPEHKGKVNQNFSPPIPFLQTVFLYSLEIQVG